MVQMMQYLHQVYIHSFGVIMKAYVSPLNLSYQ